MAVSGSRSDMGDSGPAHHSPDTGVIVGLGTKSHRRLPSGGRCQPDMGRRAEALI